MKLKFLAGALVCGALSLPALATPLMDMRIENLLPMGPDFKTALALTPNQLILWQQVESRSRAIVRERLSRRERLQAAVARMLEGKNVELRELSAPLDAEQASTAAEEKQLREMWLGLNDALDEKQRQQVVNLLAEQMMKVAGDGGERGEHGGRARPEGGGAQQRSGGGRRSGGGGMGGMGGMGGGGQ